jgi:hypothetical protein
MTRHLAVPDLEYPDPPPPADLVARVERGARRVRRRRRTAGAAAVATAVAVAAGGGTLGGSLLADEERPAPPAVDADLPPAQRNARAEFTFADGAKVWVYRDRDPRDRSHAVNCTGALPVPGQVVAACQTAGQGFPRGFVGSGFGNYENDAEIPGQPKPPPGLRRVLVSGGFGGPVTRIVVRIDGRSVEAALARDADPAVGTYWAAGALVAEDRPDPKVSWTAYRGTKVLTRCPDVLNPPDGRLSC